MTTIMLTDALYYRDGVSGVSAVVGNDYMDGAVVSRVARYTFAAPETGASHIRLTFHIGGHGSGAAVPIRYFIGTDPESHTKAGPDSPYTGELTRSDDWISMTAETDVLLIPGKTYYLWCFPGTGDFGWWTWLRANYTSQLVAEGGAFLLPVALGGVWRKIMPHVVIDGKWFLIAPCAVRGGKWHYFGSA